MPPRPYAMGPSIDGLRVVGFSSWRLYFLEVVKVLTARGRKLNWRIGQSVLCCVEGKLEVMRFLLGANTIVLSAKDSNPWREGRYLMYDGGRGIKGLRT